MTVRKKQGQMPLSHIGWRFMHIKNTTFTFIPVGKFILTHVCFELCEVFRNTFLS